MNTIRKTVKDFLLLRATIAQRARDIAQAKRIKYLDTVHGFDFDSNHGIEVIFSNSDRHCDRGDDLISVTVSFEELEMSWQDFLEHLSRIAYETRIEQEERDKKMKEIQTQEKIAQLERLKQELGL
jgi:hypothetical protein